MTRVMVEPCSFFFQKSYFWLSLQISNDTEWENDNWPQGNCHELRFGRVIYYYVFKKGIGVS